MLPAQPTFLTDVLDVLAIIPPDDDKLDKITSRLSVRYILTIKACWRIMIKRTYSCQPSKKDWKLFSQTSKM